MPPKMESFRKSSINYWPGQQLSDFFLKKRGFYFSNSQWHAYSCTFIEYYEQKMHSCVRLVVRCLTSIELHVNITAVCEQHNKTISNYILTTSWVNSEKVLARNMLIKCQNCVDKLHKCQNVYNLLMNRIYATEQQINLDTVDCIDSVIHKMSLTGYFQIPTILMAELNLRVGCKNHLVISNKPLFTCYVAETDQKLFIILITYHGIHAIYTESLIKIINVIQV